MPERIDKGWRARWEVLKITIQKNHRLTTGDATINRVVDDSYNAALNTVLEAMEILEKADRPALSRACEEFHSPATGDPRAVSKPLRVGMELPEGKDKNAK